MFTATANTRCATPSRSRFPGIGALLNVYRQRCALTGLDAHQLEDIGVSRSEADAEANRPVWDVPAHWHR